MTRIQLRRGTAAQWTSANPVLASGEMGIETDTNKFKFGDGTTAWNSLDYVITGEVITDYTELDNLPSINNITLTGNKSASDLGLQEELINGTGILISGTTISVDDSVVAMQSDIPDVSNFVTNSSLSTTLQDYQPLLESGTNLKTINNQSLLGSGNIEIQSGGTYSEGTGIDISNGVISIDTNVVATLNDIPSLTGYATEQWVQNQNYLTSSALNGYATESFVTSQGYITGITSNDVTIALGYTPYNSTNPSGYITASALTNYVTTNTAQDISGRKTFIGEKAIYFKQSATTDKLGFTLYNPSGTELAALEWRPNTISGNALLALNCPQSGSSNYVGFRYWANINIVAPRPTTNGTYFIPVNITNGTTTVTANNNGTVNISTLLPDTSGFVDTTSNQSVGGAKTFNDLRVHQYIRNVAGKIIFYGVGSSFSIGNTTCELTLDGSTTRPYYYNGTVNSEMALLSDIPTVPDIDNTTITKNTDDELQAIGVINNNSGGALKYWTGTKAQYDAIATKDATTLYNITDDTDVTLALLELLFPVGAVYFGTMATCPLQTLGVGTWQALPQDKVIQIAGIRGSVGTTINESLPNIKGEGWDLYGASNSDWSGAFSANISSRFTVSSGTANGGGKLYFNASNSSSTYQDNAPVQQDAYLLNGWRRIV